MSYSRTLQREGFEPPNRKGLDLKSSAVDRLANVALDGVFYCHYPGHYNVQDSNLRTIKDSILSRAPLTAWLTLLRWCLLMSYPGQMHRAGFEPTNHKGLDLKSSAVDRLANDAECSLWGSNPRPWCYKHHALPTALRELCWCLLMSYSRTNATCRIRTYEP